MKILIDMNLSPKWSDFLTHNGIEAVHWSSFGNPNATDIEIFTFAKQNDFVIFTNDLDFGYILAISQGKKPSIIQTRTEILGTEKIGNIVINAIKMLTEEINQGALVTINPKKTRVSLLPL